MEFSVRYFLETQYDCVPTFDVSYKIQFSEKERKLPTCMPCKNKNIYNLYIKRLWF